MFYHRGQLTLCEIVFVSKLISVRDFLNECADIVKNSELTQLMTNEWEKMRNTASKVETYFENILDVPSLFDQVT